MYDKNPPENGGFVSNLIHDAAMPASWIFLCLTQLFKYSSVNSFINQFKAAYNITPGKFRNNYRKALYT